MLKKLYSISKNENKSQNGKIEPMEHLDIENLSENEKQLFLSKGEEIIKSGRLAVITMAGGQGTRLGFNGPKGTFDMGLSSHKSLFEILSDYLKEVCKKYNAVIPWYIMTSVENYDATKEFFENHNYFGYKEYGNVVFFKQGKLPMLDENGKVIINEEGLIKEAADGHGGIFEAIYKNKVLENMKNKGIEWVFVGSVDNPLVKMADPLFIGFADTKNYLIASKTIEKAYPEEKVGVFCKKNNKPYVIEYTEISPELAKQKNEKGELLYGESHVLLNLFNIKALEMIDEAKLPYHSAHKKTKYMDEKGNVINSNEPNAYKYEMFIFDAFSIIPEIGLLRGKRENEFAPIKNASGMDSPETAKKLFEDFEKRKKEGKI